VDEPIDLKPPCSLQQHLRAPHVRLDKGRCVQQAPVDMRLCSEAYYRIYLPK